MAHARPGECVVKSADLARFLTGSWKRTLEWREFGGAFNVLRTSNSVVVIEDDPDAITEPGARYAPIQPPLDLADCNVVALYPQIHAVEIWEHCRRRRRRLHNAGARPHCRTSALALTFHFVRGRCPALQFMVQPVTAGGSEVLLEWEFEGSSRSSCRRRLTAVALPLRLQARPATARSRRRTGCCSFTRAPRAHPRPSPTACSTKTVRAEYGLG